jgi:predicted ATPase/DNA-binding SARP family transcriptional activator
MQGEAGRPPTLRVDVLGPLRLTVDGAEIDVPGPKRRAVLALLAMAAPRTVSADHLVDALWPDEPPASARGALQSHVSRIRGHLGGAACRLVADGAGYRLQLELHELDATRADALVREARETAVADPTTATELAERARALWRGKALDEFADVEPLVNWSHALEESHLAAADVLAECALASGTVGEAAQVAAENVAVEPLREASVLLLMRSLASAGRSADALRAGHDYRRRLADEAGLEPTPALPELEHRVASGSVARVPDTAVVTAPPRVVRTPPSALIGRDAELAGVARLVESERLVTLVGPGGVGKTHLALEAARRAQTGRDVVVVSLAPVGDGAAILDVLAGALGLREATADVAAACAALLASHPRLLVLDNCEHVLDDVRALVSMLGGLCPELTILATSRERIGLSFEQICRVAPLPIPEPGQKEGIAAVPSVALFLDRARRVHAGYDPTPAQLALIGGIVRRLDGMPLAIELAAGRLSSLGLADLSARLDRALDLLDRGADAMEGRHRTLRAAIEWSYELLPGNEQRLLRNLAVFADGFDLSTAEDVAHDLDGSLEPTTAVAHLVDASMVVASLEAEPRYRMLDTLRAFGLDRLAAERECDAATARLVRWAVDVARWIGTAIQTDAEPVADARLRTELGNLRAAWRAARSSGDLDAAVELTLPLHDAMSWRNLTEVGNWGMELACVDGIEAHPAAPSVLAMASEAMWINAGNLDESERLARRGLELARSDDVRGRLQCLSALGDVEHFRGRFAAARALQLEAAAIPEWESFVFAMVALGAAYGGDLDAAREWNERATSAATSPTELGFSRYAAGEISNAARDWVAAEAQYQEALAFASASGASFLQGVASVGLVSVQAAGGRVFEALTGYRELVAYWEETGGWTQQWTTLRNLADLLATLGDRESARFLTEAAQHAPEAASPGVAVRTPNLAAETSEISRERVLEVARDAIGHALTRGQGASHLRPGEVSVHGGRTRADR